MKIAIIGNGIAGISLALKLSELKPAWRISIISGESDLHFSRPALMYIFMGHMRYQDTLPYPKSFWKKKKNIELIRAWVNSVNLEEKKLSFEGSSSLEYDKLVLATGSTPNKFGWPGENLSGVQGLYSLKDLELLEQNVLKVKKAAIVGGGLIGIELAEMLHQRHIPVSFLVRESSYWSRVLPQRSPPW